MRLSGGAGDLSPSRLVSSLPTALVLSVPLHIFCVHIKLNHFVFPILKCNRCLEDTPSIKEHFREKRKQLQYIRVVIIRHVAIIPI